MKLVFALAFTAFSAAVARGQDVRPEEVGLSSEGLRKVRGLLTKLVEEKKIAGGVALVARNGKVALHAAAGFQDLEAGTPMAPDTIFRICSMTKPVTSLALMMLVEEGRLALSDPVSKFIPEFRGVKVAEKRGDAYVEVPPEREVTVRHLLTHTAGLTYGFYGRAHFSELYRRAGVSDGLVETEGTMGENCRRLASCPLQFQPGARWDYGLSTDVLGRVVEVASGLTLDEFFRRRIFEPLRMKDTAFRVPPDKRPRLAAVYRPKADQTVERQPDGPIPLGASSYSSTYPHSGPGTFFSGGAGLVSTAPDYARFLQALLNEGELDGARLAKPETVREMIRDQVPGLRLAFETHGDRFGLGFGVVSEAARDRGLGSAGTFSWGGFYHTYFFADPRKNLLGVVLTQLYPWRHMTLWKDFREAAYRALLD
jgi:CubicO group peptidase (beta-lactamase class C family)